MRRPGGLILAIILAAAPGLADAQSRPSQGPSRERSGGSGGSDLDTAGAVIGGLGWLAKKAREAEAKKKEEEARKKREQEEAARQAAAAPSAEPAPTPPAVTPEPARVPAAPPPRETPPVPDEAQPHAQPRPTGVAPPPSSVKTPAAGPSIPARPTPLPSVIPAPPPIAEVSPQPAAPANPLETGWMPVAPPQPSPPIGGLGLLLALLTLGLGAWFARHFTRWGAPTVRARVAIDPGDLSIAFSGSDARAGGTT